MELCLTRFMFTDKSTIGKLSIDGVEECYTLEDPVRDKKIKHETAIPAGIYEIIITWSPRFKVFLPLLLDVEGFSGIRIHPGNYPRDTSGCILVGTSAGTNIVKTSRKAFDKLFDKIEEALYRKQESCFIRIS